MEEICIMRDDIEENLESIIENVPEEELRPNLNDYKFKLQVYRHKTEEQEEFFRKVISFTPEEYESKLKRVQDFMMDVWAPESNERPVEKVV